MLPSLSDPYSFRLPVPFLTDFPRITVKTESYKTGVLAGKLLDKFCIRVVNSYMQLSYLIHLSICRYINISV